MNRKRGCSPAQLVVRRKRALRSRCHADLPALRVRSPFAADQQLLVTTKIVTECPSGYSRYATTGAGSKKHEVNLPPCLAARNASNASTSLAAFALVTSPWPASWSGSAPRGVSRNAYRQSRIWSGPEGASARFASRQLLGPGAAGGENAQRNGSGLAATAVEELPPGASTQARVAPTAASVQTPKWRRSTIRRMLRPLGQDPACGS